MRNLFLSLAGVAVFILIVGLISKTNQGEKTILSPYWHQVNLSGSPVTTATPNLKILKIGNTNVMVIIADNDATRSRGLGGVSQMPANQGMLFVFNSKQIRPSFWMKDMLIPLDFIWISNGKVAEITPDIP